MLFWEYATRDTLFQHCLLEATSNTPASQPENGSLDGGVREGVR